MTSTIHAAMNDSSCPNYDDASEPSVGSVESDDEPLDFGDGDSSDEPLDFGDSDTPNNPVAKKRRKLGTPSADMTTLQRSDTTSTDSKEVDIVEHAKQRLSKWAVRLFDPDRPRNVIETPQAIPLNDEFLEAFGKREKSIDKAIGREIDIDTAIMDGDDSESDVDAETGSEKQSLNDAVHDSTAGRKVKIVNLAYTTKQEALKRACEYFGPCSEVNLILNSDDDSLNAGRAYVTFETEVAALRCMEELKSLEGRPLRLSLAIETPERRPKSMGGAPSRYWEKDISTKCFRCGQIGHIAAACPNAAIEKPCPLCAAPGHEMFACPMAMICFNCGVPGHRNSECNQQRGLAKRMVCGTCFEDGHHRVSCRRPAYAVDVRHARCWVCRKTGHLMCKEMKWFVGLDGMTCFNCGQQGHSGYDCNRPGLDVCKRDPQVGVKEIERAEAQSLVDEVDAQLGRRGRDRDISRDSYRGRSQSQPPPRDYGRGYDGRNRGGNNSRRGPPQSQHNRSGGRGAGRNGNIQRGYRL